MSAAVRVMREMRERRIEGGQAAPDRLPAPAPVLRVKTEYRYQMLLKTSSRKRLSEVLADVRRFATKEKWGPANLAIDVDPMTLL